MIQKKKINEFPYLRRKVFTANEVAYIYGLAPGTLANWRHQRIGPKFYKLGRRVGYFPEDLENWSKSEPVLTRDSNGA